MFVWQKDTHQYGLNSWKQSNIREISMQTFIHIGLPKTGTTSLQRLTWPHIDGLAFLGKGSRIDPGLFKCIFNDIDLESLKTWWDKSLKKIPPNMHSVMYSHEKLGKVPAINAVDVARRVHKVVGEATILITIRRQQDIMISQFFNYQAKNPGLKFDAWFEAVVNNLGEKADVTSGYDHTYWIGGAYLYNQLRNAWHNFFPKVLVLPLEAWKRQPELVKEYLGDMLSLDPELILLPTKKLRSRSTNHPALRKLPWPIPLFFSGFGLDQFFAKRMEIKLGIGQLKMLEQAFGEENRLMNKAIPWDLGFYDYIGV
jgi:hypothetical protein